MAIYLEIFRPEEELWEKKKRSYDECAFCKANGTCEKAIWTERAENLRKDKAKGSVALSR